MELQIEPGRYVVAVSGGVDSMVLLDVLSKQSDLGLTVAHFDHGIRPDSAEDRRLVQRVADRANLPFVYDEGNLGAGTSESTARDARYKFLHNVREASGARALITAHHQDDLLETALINLLRGTGRHGLSSLKSAGTIMRPFLHLQKHQLIEYAKSHGLEWREDSTNQDTTYLRNRVRHEILTQISNSDREKLLSIIDRMRQLNTEADTLIINQLHLQPSLQSLDRHWFIMLPHTVAREVMAAWLRKNDVRNFDAKTIERLVAAAKTFHPGKQTDINSTYHLSVSRRALALIPRDR